MKKILLFVILIFCMNIMSSNIHNLDYAKNPEMRVLRETLPDSLFSIIDNKPIIVYMHGLYGCIWSVIVKDDDKFRALSGYIDRYGKNVITERTKANMFDSVAFFSKHRSLLSWGFDSLPFEAKKMRHISYKEHNIFCSTIDVFPLNTVPSFESNYAIRFSGPGSIEFNNKLNSLKVLMYWLAKPFFRTYTADSIFLYK